VLHTRLPVFIYLHYLGPKSTRYPTSGVHLSTLLGTKKCYIPDFRCSSIYTTWDQKVLDTRLLVFIYLHCFGPKSARYPKFGFTHTIWGRWVTRKSARYPKFRIHPHYLGSKTCKIPETQVLSHYLGSLGDPKMCQLPESRVLSHYLGSLGDPKTYQLPETQVLSHYLGSLNDP
jgi:hypothetical protein